MTMDFVHDHFSHQAELLRDHGAERFFAMFWEQGTGKTKSAIDQASVLFARGEIDCLLVVAPNNVHLNWIKTELPEHLPHSLRELTRSWAYSTSKAGNVGHKKALRELYEHKGLAVLAISYDSFTTDAGLKTVLAFLRKRRCFYVADEAHRIKNPKAQRTKAVLKTSKLAPYRRVLTGTPVANGPFDVYSQMKFLEERFWERHGIGTWTAFKNEFGVFKKMHGTGGRQFDLLVDYKNVEQLNRMIAPFSSRVLKEDVLDLPEKIYQKRVFEMTPRQRELYDQMRDECLADLGEIGPCDVCSGTGRLEYHQHELMCTDCLGSGRKRLIVTAPLAIVKLLRLQQITCGYLPEDGGDPFHDIPGGNPRLDDFVSIAEDTPHQGIVWAKFRRDIDKICDALGKRCTRYDGAVELDQRQRNKEAFLAGEFGWIAATTDTLGEGHTLVNALTNVYFSNTFKLTQRLQSEDRSHRIGQRSNVLYIDQIAYDTVDMPIVDALVEKRDISSQILGDEIVQWIRGA